MIRSTIMLSLLFVTTHAHAAYPRDPAPGFQNPGSTHTTNYDGFVRIRPEGHAQKSSVTQASDDDALFSLEPHESDDSAGHGETAGRVRARDRKTCVTSDGGASYYYSPQALASGGRFDPNAMTAAHRSLPFGHRVKVTNLKSGRSVIVTINDRGPFVSGRIIDLSRASFARIASLDQGVVKVRVESVACAG